MTTFSITGEAVPRPASTTDIARVKNLSDLAMSPDGTQAVFSLSDLNDAGEHIRHTLWLLDVKSRKAASLFGEPRGDSSPAWSPDGSQIAFLRAGDGEPQLNVLFIQSGEVFSLTDLESGVESFRWSPDGRQIAFSSPQSLIPDLPPAPPGVRIFTRADFLTGDDENAISQIWIVDLSRDCAQTLPRQLTNAATSATLSFWSNDGTAIFYTTNDTIEPYYGAGKSSLRSVRVADGSETLLMPMTVPGKGEDMESAPELLPSPDGSKVAFTLGNPDAPSDFAQDDIFVMDLATGATVNITAAYDREVGGDGFAWRDDHHIVAINSDAGNANLVEFDVRTGVVKPVWTGPRVVQDFQLANRGKHLLAIASDFVTPPELYEVRDGLALRLTQLNEPLQKELALTKPEVIAYRGPGGQTIHGYLHKPPHFDPALRYPLIVWAHGGPYSMWSSAYDGDIQAMAAAGYLVMYVNPRGSMSYGQAFATALANAWPGPEYEDTMAGIDYLLFRPYVDETKLGIAGGSAGAILADWAITQTDRFKAAVSISGLADNTAYWFLGDQLDIADPNSQPWQNEDDRARSPITHGLNIKTPTLYISGTEDTRTPAATGGAMMFRLLKHLRVPTALIEFEGAGHVIRGSPDARHRGLSIQYLLRWMDLHLKGVLAQEFEVRSIR